MATRSRARTGTRSGAAGGVMAIRLTLSILETLAKQSSAGVTELSRALGTTKARVYRHLRTLVDLGYAAQDVRTERYSAGPRLVALSRMAALATDDSVVRLARPAMVALRDQFGLTVNLSLVYGNSASIEETLQGSSLVGVVMQKRVPMPLHSTAAGKLLLADMVARQRPLPGPPFQRFTEYTICDEKALRAELARVQRQGWAAAAEETVLGVNAIGAPIRDHRGELVAMISVVGSIQFITHQPPRRMVEAIKRAAAGVSTAIAP